MKISLTSQPFQKSPPVLPEVPLSGSPSNPESGGFSALGAASRQEPSTADTQSTAQAASISFITHSSYFLLKLHTCKILWDGASNCLQIWPLFILASWY